MARKSWVWIEGALREKGDDNSVVIGDKIYHCDSTGRWTTGSDPGRPPMIMPDISPYKSVITGEVIGSRSTHRDHLRQHNCIEVGNEKPKPQPITYSALKGLKEELRARLFS